MKKDAEIDDSSLPIERPTFAVCRAKESLEPSPTNATYLLFFLWYFLKDFIMDFFCLGFALAKIFIFFKI